MTPSHPNPNASTTSGLVATEADTTGQLAVGRELLRGNGSSTALTIFTAPKPFGENEHIDLIQRNAIRSWKHLSDEKAYVEVVLLGSEAGVAEVAQELGVTHLPGLEYNEQGTPIVSSAFELVRQHATSPLLAYCNADVILFKDLIRSIEAIQQGGQFEKFVAFGNRTDLRLTRPVDFNELSQIERLLVESQQQGVISSQLCKEYFVFSKELFRDMPRFAIGRGNWDNWIIHHAKSLKVPVVNVSDLVTVIHQNHDYQHTGEGRMKCYVSGTEAKSNEKLGGGKHLVSGSVGTWRLTPQGLRRERPLLINRAFWADVPRFLRLVGSLLTSR